MSLGIKESLSFLQLFNCFVIVPGYCVTVCIEFTISYTSREGHTRHEGMKKTSQLTSQRSNECRFAGVLDNGRIRPLSGCITRPREYGISNLLY